MRNERGTKVTARRNVLSVADLTAETFAALLADSRRLKRRPLTNDLRGRALALIFEKPSLRTRVSFDVAMLELGGACVVLRPDEIQMGKREAIRDVAAYLSRNVSIAALRVFAHQTLVEFAQHADIPVINALSDQEHPCQALADMLTILEHKQRLAGIRIAYIGDGNNVCHSLLLASALTGASMTVVCPAGYEPDRSVVRRARTLGAPHGSVIEVRHDPAAAAGADVVYTDVWASMGQEAQAKARKRVFAPYQVNRALLATAPEAIVLHCLPAHRGEEITAEVLDGPQSVVFDQAENRRHAQKALLRYVTGCTGPARARRGGT